jgi:GT2 family glycosyltransferase/glycosyltransferase involved in cell wall biosynthesis
MPYPKLTSLTPLPEASLSALYLSLAAKEQEVMQLRGAALAREQLCTAREYRLRGEVAAFRASAAWRLAQALRRYRHTYAPLGSRRDRYLRRLWRMLQIGRREGLRGLLRRGTRKILSRCQSLLGHPRHPLDELAAGSPSAPPARELVNALACSPLKAAGREVLLDILAVAPKHSGRCGRPIDVVVPVYKGLDETLRCLRSVLLALPSSRYELIVVNDASPDPILTSCLRDIAERGSITLLENPLNLGFVQTANRGLALHPERDVVLLNSDTEVYGDWLDRLHKAAYSDAKVGTVTPMSNSATICSYPIFCEDNALPEDVTPQRLDELCAEHNAGAYVEVPTGVGFCMYFRRDCLNAVNLFDAEHFGKGYGEENDFCVRAQERGWRHLFTCDTFVYHRGGTSFGASKNPAVERAMKVLDALHPDYHAMVAAHLAANPAHPFRRRLDLARLAGPQPSVLYILHNLGGGTERHVLDLAERLEREGRQAILLRPFDAKRFYLSRPAMPDTPNLTFAVPEERWTLLAALRSLAVEHIHIHHTIDVPAEILRLVQDLELPYDWTIHDYYAICPRINLIDETRLYCGEPDASRCQLCLDSNGSIRGEKVDIHDWRADYAAWLAGARKVFVPHDDVAQRLTRYFPDVDFVVRRHFESLPQARRVAAPLHAGEPLRIAVIGALGVHKGIDILVACARDALARSLPLTFLVVGHTACDPVLREMPNVILTGRYQEEDIFDILEPLRCHCAFFPSVWPETYTYTLSIAFLGGLFPVAFDLGAPAARIRECRFGHLLPLSRDGEAINRELMGLSARLAEVPQECRWTPTDYPTLLKDYYGLIDESGRSRNVA